MRRLLIVFALATACTNPDVCRPRTLEYIAATDNGSGAFTVGLSNNVCH